MRQALALALVLAMAASPALADPPDYEGTSVVWPPDVETQDVVRDGQPVLRMDNRYKGEWRLFDLQGHRIGKVLSKDGGDNQVLVDVNGIELDRQALGDGLPDRMAAQLAARHAPKLALTAAVKRNMANNPGGAPAASGWRLDLDRSTDRFKIYDGATVVARGLRMSQTSWYLHNEKEDHLGIVEKDDEGAWKVMDNGRNVLATEAATEAAGEEAKVVVRLVRRHLAAITKSRAAGDAARVAAEAARAATLATQKRRRVVGYLASEMDNGWLIERRGKRVGTIERAGSGWKVYDAGHKLLGTIKPDGDGWEIRDTERHVLGTADAKGRLSDERGDSRRIDLDNRFHEIATWFFYDWTAE